MRVGRKEFPQPQAMASSPLPEKNTSPSLANVFNKYLNSGFSPNSNAHEGNLNKSLSAAKISVAKHILSTIPEENSIKITPIDSTYFYLDLSHFDFSDPTQTKLLLTVPKNKLPVITSINFSDTHHLSEEFAKGFLVLFPHLKALNFKDSSFACSIETLATASFIYDGEGSCTFPNGERYVGKWKLGLPHGIGTFTDKEKNVYKGAWKEGKKEGLGKMSFADGSTFEGNFKNGLYHGKGVFTSPNGSSYCGDWEKGKKKGRGKILYEDGCTYEGEFKNNKQQGLGKFTTFDGFSYEGEWDANSKLVRVR